MDFAPVQRIDLPCGPIAYRQSGSGTPLVLIHGWRGSSRYWQGTLDAFSEIRHTYALDLPGHGETPPRATPLDIDSLAAMTLDLADRWGLERFDLAGHSFGGAVAIALAARWPQRVRRLTVASLGTVSNGLEQLALGQAHAQIARGLGLARPWLDLGRPWLGLMQPWVDRIGGTPWVSQALAGAFAQRLPDDPSLIRDGVQEFLRTDPVSALEIAVASGNPAFLQSLSKVTAPTLLICGDGDRIMPVSSAKALAARLPGSRLETIPQCGHLPMIEHPEAFHRLVRDFLLGSE
jgi:pimeloyl-ACP methyl ester carboxylesterase